MSNPLINRWGFNLFWYNYWFSDCNANKQYSLDFVITKLLYIYINFGLLFKKNIFYSFYFFKNAYKNKNSTNLFKSFDQKYFRMLEHKNKITGELTRFYTRIQKKDIYFSKIWILKYQGWIVINSISFQPVKKKKISKRMKKYLASTSDYRKHSQNTLLFLRLKIYLTYLLKNNQILKKNTYYFF